MLKKFRIVSVVMALSLGLMACTGNEDPEIPVEGPPIIETPTEGETSTPETETPSEPDSPADNTGDTGSDEVVTLMAAEEVFDQYALEYPNMKFEEMSLDKNFDNYVYKLEGSDDTGEHEFEINAQDGSLIKKDLDDDMDFSGEITNEHVAKVNSFIDQALADAGSDANLDEWTLSVDDGLVKIEIDIDMGVLDSIEYTYDVDSGNLLEKDN